MSESTEVEVAPKRKRVVRKTKPDTELAMVEGKVVRRKVGTPKAMLYRGATRLQLINDLAEGKHDHATLAAKHRVQKSDIADFYVKYQTEIEEQKDRIEQNQLDEYALLTFHKKAARIAMYDEQIRLCDEYIAWCEESGRHIPPAIMKLQQTALRSVAEEMGDLKTNVAIEHTMVDHTINGMSNDELKALT